MRVLSGRVRRLSFAVLGSCVAAGLVAQIPHAVAARPLAAPGALPTDAPAPPPATPAIRVHEWPAQSDPSEPVEIVSRRTAHARVFKVSRKSLRAEIHATPVHFKNADGNWQRIDNSVVADLENGGLRSKANSWTARFGSTSEGVSVTTADGVLTFAPRGAAEVQPVVADDGMGVVYPEAWPGVDLVYHVESDRLEEDIVLKTPTDRSSFAFTVRDTGVIAGSSEKARFLPPEVFDKSDRPVPEANPRFTTTDAPGDSTDLRAAPDPPTDRRPATHPNGSQRWPLIRAG